MNIFITLLNFCFLFVSNFNSLSFNKVDFISEEKVLNEIVNIDYICNYEEFYITESQYENNDNYDDATNISPSDYYEQYEYYTFVDGVLYYSSGYHDMDFLYFKLLTESEVEININGENNNFNFDFELIGYDYYSIYDENSYHTTVEIYSDFLNTNSKNYTGVLSPGTYFIYLRGKQSVENNINYNLELHITKESNFPSVSLDFLRETSLIGAVWISDFVPAGLNNFFDLNSNITYYQSSVSGLNYPDYALDDLYYISNGDRIKLASYYIWNQEVINILYETIHAVLDQYDEFLFSEYTRSVELSIQRDTVTGVISVTGFIVSTIGTMINVSVSTGIICSAATNLLIDVVNCIYDSLINRISPIETLYCSYLSQLYGTLQALVNNPYNAGLIFDMYYSLEFEGNIYSSTAKHKVTLSSTYLTRKDICFSVSSSQDTIYSSYISDYYCRGKIYGLTQYDDISNISGLSFVPTQHSHYYVDHYCSCGDYTSTHDYHEPYIWQNMHMHRATCGCGAFTNQGHAVLGSSIGSGVQYATCILCGGTAQIGIIQNNLNILHHSINGSVILNNGVIVLTDEDVENYLDGTIEFFYDDTL